MEIKEGNQTQERKQMRSVTARKAMPFPLWQREALERWLEEQGRSGLLLENIRWTGIACFSSDSHTRKQYKIISYEAISDEACGEEQEKIPPSELDVWICERGWEIAAEWKGHYFLRKKDFFAEALPPEKENHDKRLRNEEQGAYIGILLYILSSVAGFLIRWRKHGEWNGIVASLLAVALVLSLISAGIAFRPPKDIDKNMGPEEYRQLVRRGYGLFVMRLLPVLYAVLKIVGSILKE